MTWKQTWRKATRSWRRGALGLPTGWIKALRESVRESVREHDGRAETGLGFGSLLNVLDWDQVRSEVDRESRARIVLAGATGCGKTTLLHRLKGWCEGDAPMADLHDFGMFVTLDVCPSSKPNETPGQPELRAFDDDERAPEPQDNFDPLALQSADLIIWMLDARVGLCAWEYAQLGRLRTMARPLLVVLNKCDGIGDVEIAGGMAQRLGQQLAAPVIPISALTGLGVADALLPAIANACPNLTLALGREVPLWREVAVRRATQRAAALSGLVGVEPVPLLDLPFQVLIQLRLVLRIAAMFGEPLGDRYSRELLATLFGGALARYAGQQVAKAVPVVGWGISGALAAGTTLAMGKLAQTYFGNGRRWPKLKRTTLVQRWRKQRCTPNQADAGTVCEEAAPCPSL